MGTTTRDILTRLTYGFGFPVPIKTLKKYAGKEHVSDASFRVYISKARKALYPNEKIVATKGGYELQIAG